MPNAPVFHAMLDSMVAVPAHPNEPTRRSDREKLFRDAPLLWRGMLRLDRALVRITGTLEITGDVPDELRGTPVLLAANHIGNVDALVLVAACAHRRLAPKFLVTGGLFDTPVLGKLMRDARHVRVDRDAPRASEALQRAVTALGQDHRPLLVYPEGRVSIEPGLWPERGKTGVARMALATGVPVIPVSQWGAHEAMSYGTTTQPNGFGDFWRLFVSWVKALRHRPRLKVHFGAPVDLSGLSAERVGDAARARDRIMFAITDGLAPLRIDELDVPRHVDPTRPASTKRCPWRDAVTSRQPVDEERHRES